MSDENLADGAAGTNASDSHDEELHFSKPIDARASSPRTESRDQSSSAASRPVRNSQSDEPTPRVGDSDSIEANISNSRQIPAPLSLEQQLQKAKKDLEGMVIKYARSESECILSKGKIGDLDNRLKRVIKDNEQLANRIKLLTNDKNHLSDALSAKVAQLTVLEQKNLYLNNVQGKRLKELEEKLILLEDTNCELQKKVDDFTSKEGDLLDLSERLSMKHLMLQSELDEALRQNSQAEDSGVETGDDLTKQNEELSARVGVLEDLLQRERALIENLKLDKSKLESRYQRDLDELSNELKLARRKHQILLKEMTREIRLLKGATETTRQ